MPRKIVPEPDVFRAHQRALVAIIIGSIATALTATADAYLAGHANEALLLGVTSVFMGFPLSAAICIPTVICFRIWDSLAWIYGVAIPCSMLAAITLDRNLFPLFSFLFGSIGMLVGILIVVLKTPRYAGYIPYACLNCGYLLESLENDVPCPECGSANIHRSYQITRSAK